MSERDEAFKKWSGTIHKLRVDDFLKGFLLDWTERCFYFCWEKYVNPLLDLNYKLGKSKIKLENENELLWEIVHAMRNQFHLSTLRLMFNDKNECAKLLGFENE